MSENDPKPPSEGQVRELFSIAMHTVPADRVQATIERPHAFIAHVRAFFAAVPTIATNPVTLLASRIALLEHAGFTWNGPREVPSDLPSGFVWPIPVPKGMTPNKAFALCKERFPAWRYTDDLDTAVTMNDRDPQKGSYVIWVRSLIEADEELKGLSANQLKEQGIHGITLTERLLLEWFTVEETREHLDVKNWTLCSGSRGSGGGVPRVCWVPTSGGLDVYWAHPGSRDGSLRTRRVVSSVSS